jgi:hypothetical protein
MFICRNYALGDQIYLFGFSRGSFTVRVLAGFIAYEGLVQYSGDENLDYQARDAYRAYRRTFDQTISLVVNPLRNLRDGFLGLWRRWNNCRIYAEVRETNHQPRIAFIGVFDTVAAYGTPIAEITRGIDKWVWPLSMPNYTLSDKVDAARHALSLDDERDTFHPLLWDEYNSSNPDRILQVWFAGVHSDVGGGYPDDTLSYIPLKWMLGEAKAANLAFAQTAVDEIQRIACGLGPLHDSRRGLAGYYRYQPRKISARLRPPDPTTLLMQDPTQYRPGQRAQLRSVNIHQSVFERIASGNDSYAPIVLNGAYNVIGRPKAGAGSEETTPLQRAEDQERVWDWVWHKRVNYFLTLGASIYLGFLPVLNLMTAPAPCAGPQCLLAPVIKTVGQFLPGFAGFWVNAFAATPGRTAVAALILTVLLMRSGILQQRIRAGMRALWEQSLGLDRVSVQPKSSAAWIRKLRKSRRYQLSLQCLKWRALPNIFGFVLLGTMILAFLTTSAAFVVRWSAWSNEHATAECDSGITSKTDPKYVDFETKTTCLRLSTEVKAGHRYRATVAVKKPWSDASISTDPHGFGPERMPLLGNTVAPMRRSPMARWFQPLIKIVAHGKSDPEFRIEPLDMNLTDPANGIYMAEFKAPISGSTYFFVNDVLLPKWTEPLFQAFGWISLHIHGKKSDLSYDFYRNNAGTAEVKVESAD